MSLELIINIIIIADIAIMGALWWCMAFLCETSRERRRYMGRIMATFLVSIVLLLICVVALR